MSRFLLLFSLYGPIFSPNSKPNNIFVSSSSDWEASIATITTTAHAKTLCWYGLGFHGGVSNNCEEGPLQQSATPTTFIPEVVVGEVEDVANNTKSYT